MPYTCTVKPVRLPAPQHIVSIVASGGIIGYDSSFAITQDHALWEWGDPIGEGQGILNDPGLVKPTIVFAVSNATAVDDDVSYNGNQTLALKIGAVFPIVAVV